MLGAKAYMRGGKLRPSQWSSIVNAPRNGRKVTLMTKSHFTIKARWLFGAWRNWGYKIAFGEHDPVTHFQVFA